MKNSNTLMKLKIQVAMKHLFTRYMKILFEWLQHLLNHSKILPKIIMMHFQGLNGDQSSQGSYKVTNIKIIIIKVK